jgi:hypothetical protein
LKGRHSQFGGQKKHVSFANGMSHSAMHDLARTVNAQKHPRLAHGPYREGRLTAQPPQPEVLTFKKFFASDMRHRLRYRINQARRAVAKIDTSKSFIHLQRPRLTGLGVNAIPIV